MNPNDIIMYATIKDECKKELDGDNKPFHGVWQLKIGETNSIYDGIWRVMGINYRTQEVDLSNGRISISRKFSEIDITIEVKETC